MSFLKTLLATILGIFITIFLFGIVGVLILVAIINSAPSGPVVSRSSVLILDLPSSIAEATGGTPVNFSLRGLNQLTMLDYLRGLDRVKADDNIEGIRLKVENYGGSWAQAEELRAKILEVRNAGKFVYATSGVEGMDEKQYFIATAADSILADPSAYLEMNGIVAVLEFYKPLLDRLKIKAEVVRAGSYKSAVEPFIRETASDENREMITSIVDHIMGRFKSVVLEERGVSPETLQQVMDERAILTTSEALQQRLIDAVLYEDQIQDVLRNRLGIGDSSQDVRTVDFDDYVGDGEDVYGSGDGQIAVVYAAGGIIPGVSRYSPNPIFGGDMVGSDTFSKAMREIRENDYIKAVVVRIESPGGDARASEAMWREIILTRATKPVMISMAGVAASGGYFMAAAGDTIVCEPTTLTGSIGVFSMQLDMQEFFRDKIGINTELIETNPHADMAVSMSEAERAIIARSVDTTYARFLRIVADGRHLSIDSVRHIAEGRVWTGEQAQRIGLVDLLGGLDSALSIAARRVGFDSTYSIRVFPERKNAIEAVVEALTTRASAILGGGTPVEGYRELLTLAREYSTIQSRMTMIRFQ